MLSIKSVISALALVLCLAGGARAGKLAIVIDDFGYRPHNENQVLAMPLAISIAVLPDAPHAREMATKAHQQGRQVLIHLPMAPLSKQPLERNTLQPAMSPQEVERIIREAVAKVPYAVGLNNHMGSAMTSSLSGMQHVMQVLNHYSFYFLDSMTIGNSQSVPAAIGTNVKVIKRNVFLDDSQNEADIRQQFNRAVALARKNGSAIAIGHPHPTTIRVLQQMLPNLPADIVLVRPDSLLNAHFTPSPGTRPTPMPTPAKPHRPLPGTGQCRVKTAPKPVYADAMFSLIGNSLSEAWQALRQRAAMPPAPAEKAPAPAVQNPPPATPSP